MRGHDGPSVIVQLGGFERHQDSLSGHLPQYRLKALRSAHMEALSLGARQGMNADALAQHYARQHRASFVGRAA
ncbi:hypothetical protein ACO2Q1_00230 [Brevundimonas sp. VNH65]|uniref:hypothetical protein n=1 Tax=Brevundimonas sp. VNH65 TaxID=3400917 RepID=UPI003C0DF36E